MHVVKKKLLAVCGLTAITWLFVPCLSGQETEPSRSGETALLDESDAEVFVSLAIDFGDGFEKRYTELPFADEMTVMDLMSAARDHKHPTPFTHRGSQATAFLTSLDGCKNEGASGKNWLYYVNNERGDRSFGVRKLNAGDAVSWRFE